MFNIVSLFTSFSDAKEVISDGADLLPGSNGIEKKFLFWRNDALSGNQFYGYDEYVDENIIFKNKIFFFWNLKNVPIITDLYRWHFNVFLYCHICLFSRWFKL